MRKRIRKMDLDAFPEVCCASTFFDGALSMSGAPWHAA